MLGQRTDSDRQEARQKTYLNVKNGAIVRRTETGEEEYFSYVEGILSSIFQKGRTFRGEKVVYWYIDLRDEEGELYSIGLPFSNNVFKSIVLSLSSDRGIEMIRKGATIKIEPYRRDTYDKVNVYADGEKLDWGVKTLPPIEEVSIGGRTIKDDSKRMELIVSLAEKVKSNICIK